MDRRRTEPQRGSWATGLCAPGANHAYGSAYRATEVTGPDFPGANRVSEGVTHITPEQLDTLRRFAALGPAVTADRTTDRTTDHAEAPDAPR